MTSPILDSDLLRLSEASRFLGVGDTTLKRWTEEGRIPCERTLGGHRRFRREEVAKLRSQLLGEKPAPPARALESDTRAWLDVHGDPTEPTALLGRLMLLRSQSRDWAEAGDRLCAGLLTEIGERWSGGRMTCADEHAMSRSLEVALTRIGHQFPVQAGSPTVTLACPAGERHTLGLTLVETALRERGVHVQYLGADVPTSDIVEAVRRTRPAAVGLSAASHPRPAAELAEPARAVAQVCAEVHALLFLGGCAAWPAVRGAQRTLTLRDLMTSIESLPTRPDVA